ncbi:hypothetical protein AAV35_000815 [Salimicrobium jeotgali]|uniref:DUF2187 domain-containing protein n=1 Tax=Salimicrobium jeotgali TaxID=1230341 RepID=K2G697_9BACI|nr:DUF2187 family protein [Salimicrobium jeotgali]AKG03463.1 hypothetical protein AAV35_000815 [Salimicrobium jeotgali]EKE30698.1 hypothetical protein MJ3_12050 [Salimicrobium jeotgali]MBM7697173.1 uncharacterized protein YkvS [Salimicrobium jeotgali]
MSTVEENGQAQIGDIVTFTRKKEQWMGKVVPSGCANSVIVDLRVMEELPDRENSSYLTCVNHKNYHIVSRAAETSVE